MSLEEPVVPADAPFGVEALRAVPRPVYAVAALLGLGLLAASLAWSGGARGLALLAGLILADLGQAGLRPVLRDNARRGFLLLALLLAGGLLLRPALRWQEKRAELAESSLAARFEVRETAGVARRQELALLPLVNLPIAAASTAGGIAVYEGLRRLPSTAMLEAAEPRIAVVLDLGANESKTLELYFGAAPTAQPDPEETWPLENDFRRGMSEVAWSLQGLAGTNRPPLLGRSFLRVAARPDPAMPGAFVSMGVPLEAPAAITPRTHLVYALRMDAPGPLVASVQVDTDQGPLWRQAPVDQEGRAADAWGGLGDRAAGRWYLRRIPMGNLAGARIRNVHLNVSLPDGEVPQPGLFEIDALGWAEGPPLKARRVD